MKPDLRNAAAFIVPDMFWGLGWGIALDYPLPAAFVTSIGGSPDLLGHFNLVTALALGLPMLVTGWLLAPLRRKRGFVILTHVITAGTLLVLSAYLYLGAHLGTTALAIGWVVAQCAFWFMLGLGIPAWLGLLGDVFPDTQRARVLGLVFVANRATAIPGGLMAEHILGLGWAPGHAWSLLFGIAGLTMLIGSFPFALAVEADGASTPRPRLRSHLRQLGSQWHRLPDLRRFICIDSFSAVGIVLLAFYGDAAIRAHAAPESKAGGWASMAAGAQMCCALAIALLGSRVRPRHWLVAAALLVTVGSMLAATATHAGVFGVVAALSGIYLVARNSSWAPQVLRLAPGEDTAEPIALAGAILLPLQGILVWTAGLALSRGVAYSTIFWIVATVAGLVALGLWLAVPDHGAADPDIGKTDS